MVRAAWSGFAVLSQKQTRSVVFRRHVNDEDPIGVGGEQDQAIFEHDSHVSLSGCSPYIDFEKTQRAMSVSRGCSSSLGGADEGRTGWGHRILLRAPVLRRVCCHEATRAQGRRGHRLFLGVP